MSVVREEIANILQDNGFGTIGVDIFATNDVPDKPDKRTIIRRTTTSRPDLPNIDLQYPVIQLIFRDSRGKGIFCENFAEDVAAYMKTIYNYTILDAKYIYINLLNGPNDLGLDEVMRPSFSLNLDCNRTKL
jgi:hypothetical protein